MIVTRSDIESFKRFVPKLALAGAAVLILSAFAPSSDAAVFTAREGDAPLEFTLPAHETTMVAIPADPIASAVYDRHLIDVQTDAASGMLYVLPKMEGSAMVYVTCRSGETAPLHRGCGAPHHHPRKERAQGRTGECARSRARCAPSRRRLPRRDETPRDARPQGRRDR